MRVYVKVLTAVDLLTAIKKLDKITSEIAVKMTHIRYTL